jgi:hypothetical protein
LLFGVICRASISSSTEAYFVSKGTCRFHLMIKLCSHVQAIKTADTLSILPPTLQPKIQNLFTSLPNAISTRIRSWDK